MTVATGDASFQLSRKLSLYSIWNREIAGSSSSTTVQLTNIQEEPTDSANMEVGERGGAVEKNKEGRREGGEGENEGVIREREGGREIRREGEREGWGRQGGRKNRRIHIQRKKN